VKYLFCRTLADARETEQEAKVAMRLAGERCAILIYDSFIENRDPGY
jgi:serine/threonine protein kinase